MLDATSLQISYPETIPNDIEGWIALGAALIFSAGLRHRLQRCHYAGNRELSDAKCQNFVFTFPESRRPKLYCSEEHFRKQEVVRVSKY